MSNGEIAAMRIGQAVVLAAFTVVVAKMSARFFDSAGKEGIGRIRYIVLGGKSGKEGGNWYD